MLLEAGRDIFTKTQRAQAERLVRGEKSSLDAAQVPSLAAIQEVWSQTTLARNSVAHAGATPAALSAQEIEATAERVCAALRPLLR